ncbi:M23 family metallopeptidase [Ramlibacter sp.]|uniref:M23 family metallopeptidase n=1 Tax=Ramlibacter sp. TaxID=1917967 RepID=UPI0035B130DF
MQDILIAAARLKAAALHTLEHHPRHITAAIAAVLLGGGGGAFAVASLGPDPAAMPVRQVIESVEPLPLAAQSDALDLHRYNLYLSDTVRPNDTVDTLLARLGVSDAAAAAFLRQDANVRQQLLGLNGRQVRVETTEERQLARLTARWTFGDNNLFKRLVVERTPEGRLASRIEIAPLSASYRLGSGTIRSSLFAATDESGIADPIAIQLANIFAGDIDFHRGLRKGDRFSVVYKTLEADGEPLRTGRVISAEFVNAGRVKNALWFQEPGTQGGYYDFSGESLERAYLASPMEFSRVTSGFAMRLHPIFKTWRAHMGVDYGAPTGTPVRVVGNGVVDFAGVMGGYGKVVRVRHGQGDETLYAHLSRIDVRQGQSVQRGERIGAVGATGWATGPHLHFEFRQNGQHRDPIEIARKSESRPLAASARPAFEQAVASLRVQLSAAATTTVAARME